MARLVRPPKRNAARWEVTGSLPRLKHWNAVSLLDTAAGTASYIPAPSLNVFS